MKVRRLLWLTAIISSILGAVVAYLVLTVPNDLKADSMLKTAREHLAAGNSEEAHDSLARIVEQYPRTDAAAAATVALMKLSQQQRSNLQREIEKVRSDNSAQAKQLTELQKSVDILKTPPPAPKPEPVVAAKPPAKKPAAKTTKKKTTKRRR